MAIKSDREYRDMTLAAVPEVREEGDESVEEQKIVRGYASTFDEPYTLYEDDDLIYNEVVDRSAFDNTDMSDVIFQYNHEGRVYARQSNDTLRVLPDEKGLLIEADLGGTAIGRELYDEIRGGYTNKMSFGFTVNGEDESRQEAADGRVLITRTITSVRKLYDVSAVSIPANDATSISVRNLTDGVIEKIQAERLEAEKLELKRRKLKLMLEIDLEGGR